MCTQARSPSPSRATEIASSKSFAVSGSMVNAVSSRRSTRPSSDGSGRSWGSNAVRALVDEQRLEDGADVVGAAEDALEPGAAAPGPDDVARVADAFRSSMYGGAASKKGSPTTSLPRVEISTTALASRTSGERTAWRYSSVAIAVSSASSSAVLDRPRPPRPGGGRGGRCRFRSA